MVLSQQNFHLTLSHSRARNTTMSISANNGKVEVKLQGVSHDSIPERCESLHEDGGRQRHQTMVLSPLHTPWSCAWREVFISEAYHCIAPGQTVRPGHESA